MKSYNSKDVFNDMNKVLIMVDHDFDKYYPKSRMIRTFGDGTVIYILNENLDIWDNGINDLYKEFAKKEKNVSFSRFYEYIHSHITKDGIKGIDSSNGIVEYFSKQKIENYRFIKPLFGFELKLKNYLVYNDITFIKKAYVIEYLKKKDEKIQQFIEDIIQINEECIFLEIQTNAKDINKATEMAEEKYRNIDYCIRFLLKNDNSIDFHIGIYNLNYYNVTGFVGYGNDCYLVKHQSSKRIYNFESYIEFLFESDYAKLVWNLFDDNDLNEMECRLKEAIIWTAKATHENDDSIAYVECFLALEAILMEQDGFINKSITAQISEYVAFLLCKELDKRIALEKKLKQLYKIRSAIAHGKNINNISMEVRDIFKIVKHVIYLILYADKNTRKFKNIKELRDFITILKFK